MTGNTCTCTAPGWCTVHHAIPLNTERTTMFHPVTVERAHLVDVHGQAQRAVIAAGAAARKAKQAYDEAVDAESEAAASLAIITRIMQALP